MEILLIRYWMMHPELLEIQTRMRFIVTVQVQVVNPQTGKEALGTGWSNLQALKCQNILLIRIIAEPMPVDG